MVVVDKTATLADRDAVILTAFWTIDRSIIVELSRVELEATKLKMVYCIVVGDGVVRRFDF